jgi:hypothetical protein
MAEAGQLGWVRDWVRTMLHRPLIRVALKLSFRKMLGFSHEPSAECIEVIMKFAAPELYKPSNKLTSLSSVYITQAALDCHSVAEDEGVSTSLASHTEKLQELKDLRG